MTSRIKDYLQVAVGLIMLSTGLFMFKTLSNPQGVMQVVPFVCIGLGCGIFGHGMGNYISTRAMEKHPDIKKQIEIETKDERNIAISHRAKAKAYDMMVFVFGAVMLSFALMRISVAAILLLVSAYLFVVSYGIYYRIRYNQEM